MWGVSVMPFLAASTIVSGLYLAFFVLEQCVNAQCPYKEQGPVPSVPLPRVSTLLYFNREPWELTTNSFSCIAKSQMACLAAITFAWCSGACALLLLLSGLCPNPRPEEVAAFRNSSLFSLLQQAVMLTYVAGVQGGFQDSVLCLLFWSSKFSSRQLQSVLPLRSEAIRKARQVKTSALLTLLSAYSCGAVLSTAASVALWSVRPWMSPIVFFELWALPLDALAFLHLAFSECLHIAEEVSVGGKASEPLVSPEKRMELSEGAALLQGTVKGAVVLCHRVAMLFSFGLQWRVADMVLLLEIRLSARRVLLNVQSRLQHCIAQSQADKRYPCATPDELEDDSPCPICQLALCCNATSKSNVPKRLPCGHIFHLSCVVRWITHNQGRSVACPMCRTQLLGTEEPFSCWQATIARGLEWWMECPWQLVRWMFVRLSQHLPSQTPPNSELSPPALEQGGSGTHQHSSSGTLRSDAPAPTPENRGDTGRVLLENMHTREAVLSSQIAQEDLARFQAEMHGSSTPAMHGMQPNALDGELAQAQSSASILSRVLGGLGQAPPSSHTLHDADGVHMTPAVHPVVGETPLPAHAGTTPMQRDFSVSDAMVGTEVASLVLQSPLWSMLSPRLTGRSNRRRV